MEGILVRTVIVKQKCTLFWSDVMPTDWLRAAQVRFACWDQCYPPYVRYLFWSGFLRKKLTKLYILIWNNPQQHRLQKICSVFLLLAASVVRICTLRRRESLVFGFLLNVIELLLVFYHCILWRIYHRYPPKMYYDYFCFSYYWRL